MNFVVQECQTSCGKFGLLHSLAFAFQANTSYIILIRLWHTCLVLKIEPVSLTEVEAELGLNIKQTSSVASNVDVIC